MELVGVRISTKEQWVFFFFSFLDSSQDASCVLFLCSLPTLWYTLTQSYKASENTQQKTSDCQLIPNPTLPRLHRCVTREGHQESAQWI